MTLQLTPESGVPLNKSAPKLDLKDRAAACAKTVELLTSHGMEAEASEEDRDTAAALAVAYAQNPEKTSKAATAAGPTTHTCGAARNAQDSRRVW
jgi:hypothetical protein